MNGTKLTASFFRVKMRNPLKCATVVHFRTFYIFFI